MKAHEILYESVTFSIGKLTDVDGSQYYVNPFEKEVEKSCWACDGSGKDQYAPEGSKDSSCDMCNGTGKIKERESPAGEMNLANSNAAQLLSALGVDNSNWGGVIHNKDLPALRRKLIQLKNQDSENLVEPPSFEHGRRSVSTDDNGVSRINTGPRIYHGGRTSEQINRYIDSLFKMVDFAQKNDCDLIWG